MRNHHKVGDRLRRIRRAVQRALPAAFPSVTILLYHRIADLEVDPWDLCVSPDTFAEQLEVIRACGRCLTLEELVRGWDTGPPPEPCFVVTFDDGYSDNLEVAKPLLERFDVPATMFLVSSVIGMREEFWWDALERVFLQPVKLPPKLILTVGAETRSWDLGLEADCACVQSKWRANEHIPPGCRQAIFLEVWNLLCRLESKDRQAYTNDILAWAGLGPAPRDGYCVLGPDGALALGSGGLIEIGAHTRTHPSLTNLTLTAQQEEVAGCKADLQQLLGREVTTFSYPYGRHNAAIANLVRANGFLAACTCEERPAWPNDDRFRLPRIQVKNWDGDAFSKELLRK